MHNRQICLTLSRPQFTSSHATKDGSCQQVAKPLTQVKYLWCILKILSFYQVKIKGLKKYTEKVETHNSVNLGY